MAYDLVTGQRTFCIGLSATIAVDKTTTLDVPFRDTGGNDIKCSYLKLQGGGVIGSGKKIAVIAELSGVSHLGDAVTDGLSALSSTPAPSGICGIGVILGYLDGNEAEWHGSNGQVATGIRLVMTGDTTIANIMLTYGNLFGLNSRRLEQSYDAGS